MVWLNRHAMNSSDTARPIEVKAADLLTEEQAANFLSVKPRTLRLWRRSRGLPHVKITSKIVRYRRIDLDGWLEHHRVATV